MAISSTHHQIVRTLFESNILPKGGALLELGEANWYDPTSAAELASEIRKYVADATRRDGLLNQLERALAKAHDDNSRLFDVAKVFYEIFFAPSEVQAIDFHGTAICQPLDLNEPLPLKRKFDVVINHGTAEHIFNIAQVFRSIHDFTVPGGLMMHESPFTGWVEHGFYSLQPTLYFDVAAYNRYSIICMIIEDLHNNTILPIVSRDDVYQFATSKKIPENSVLFTVLRKDAVERPFAVPIQSVYREGLSSTGADAWHDLR